MRKTTGSMICPQCAKLIGVGEEKCPFCGAWRPGLYGYTPALQRFFGSRIDLIALISSTCVVLFVTSLLLDPSRAFRLGGGFDLFIPGGRALDLLGMTSAWAIAEGRWWTLLTAIYLHGGLIHILLNVMWIRQLGPAVTEYYGPARAFVVFTISGAAGFALSLFADGGASVGASGGIFGLFASLIVYGRRARVPVLSQQMWMWAVFVFLFGLLGQSVDNWAHAGGFAAGWVAAEGMRASDARESRGVQLLALALLAATAAGYVLALLRVTGRFLGFPH